VLVPALQGVQLAAPAEEYIPMAQSTHVPTVVAPTAFENRPASQAVQTVVAPGSLYEPAVHASKHCDAPSAEKKPEEHWTQEEEVTAAVVE
jgi:hypothetical protein